MCGLVGISGNFNKELLFSMMESTKHRGEDSSGFYLYKNDKDDGGNEESIFQNNYVIGDTVNSNNTNFNIGLGHNLLSIFSLINENSDLNDSNDCLNENFQQITNSGACLNENFQPIVKNELVIIFNGEIYNFTELECFLKENNENYVPSKTDSQLLANLIDFYLINEDNSDNNTALFNAIKLVIPQLDGDYSFAIYDTKGDNLAISRDSIGVKPLFYGVGCDGENNIIRGFASEKKALWNIGISDENIKDLKPGSILYNWEAIDLEEDLINKIIFTDFKELKKNFINYKEYINTKDTYENYKELLSYNLLSAVEKRVKNLSNVGLIFSGGVDSTILAVLLKEVSENRQKMIDNGESIEPLNFKLYSVGVENSQDIKASKEIAEELGLELKTIIIDQVSVKNSVKSVLRAIEDDNIMKLGVGMTLYLASKAMKEDGIKVAISGQGADELFGGYNRYLKHFEDNSLFDAYFDLDEEIYHDIANMYHVNLERDDAVTMANGVELRVPFLDKDIIKLALDVPAKFKIFSGEDILRKHILRDVALDIGVPIYIANRPKKAAQYGSGINKILKKKVLKSFNIEEFINSMKYNNS